MIIEDPEQSLQFPACLRMDKPQFLLSFQEILQRLGLIIFVPQIIPGCADPVHDHLRNIFPGHGHAIDDPVISRYIIDPVFVMMPVASLMVKPGKGKTCFFSLCIIWASVPLIVLTAYQKFHR